MCIVICTLLLSCPARGAWVEIDAVTTHSKVEASCPARGAWVEIIMKTLISFLLIVVPRKGRVG